MPAGAHKLLLTGALAAIAALVVAAPANAATVTSAVIEDGWDDYCGEPYDVRYAAIPGERNDLQVSFSDGEYFPAPWAPGPICWQMTSDVATLTDLTAPITATGICRSVGPQAARCGANMIWKFTIWTGDLRDLVKVGNTPPARIAAGPGNDALNAANGSGYDEIFCGTGTDGVTADPGDAVAADCENVTRVG